MSEQANSTILAIIKTIIWYDMFDFPLTAMELWQYGFFKQKIPLQEVEAALFSLPQGLARQGGFYCLVGREETIQVRQRRYAYADAKVKKAQRIIKLFRFIPWLKFVGLVNIYGAHNLKASGDIDLFIITAKGRIWLTRFLAVGLIKLLNLRPQPNDNQDKICLSFFISEANLDLSRVRIEGDLYSAYLAYMAPLYDLDQSYSRLVAANQWLQEELPNLKLPTAHDRRLVAPVLSPLVVSASNLLLGWLEFLARQLQLKILAKPIRQLMNLDTRVMISDDILKMHTNDRRQEIIDRYQNKLNEYFTKN